jgi:hypothetical protein
MNKEFDEQINICNKSFFSNYVQGGCQLNDPIFILGLPRAGSTLIEQILSLSFND